MRWLATLFSRVYCTDRFIRRLTFLENHVEKGIGVDCRWHRRDGVRDNGRRATSRRGRSHARRPLEQPGDNVQPPGDDRARLRLARGTHERSVRRRRAARRSGGRARLLRVERARRVSQGAGRGRKNRRRDLRGTHRVEGPRGGLGQERDELSFCQGRDDARQHVRLQDGGSDSRREYYDKSRSGHGDRLCVVAC